MQSHDEGTGAESRLLVPAAFYRDAAPRPPRDDPHWVEFPAVDESDTLPAWLIWAIPVVAALVMVLHGVLALVLVLWLQR